ncbi:MAG: TnsD family transposase [Candidatus Thiodiazotropha endolucinida]|nr:TnsD family transposase [Candidatus Thiodiazotropha taylori]MCG8071219.1 TnsD family transposase [Candidatus Thiodiazotropha taylori]MCG8094925.1 TnsD family transposase [Candidatus Thiodiazotropha endolucinida]MCW4325232.1 TnsD family transposase [Candidatus Thiodiazotropha taylori]MCW4343663.1 TnsD family transposase [Candidatus Thiodiazotropha endolucinida]
MTLTVIPVRGESIYSILSRVHTIEGRRSPLDTLRIWTGVRGYKPLSGLPTCLAEFSRHLKLSGGAQRLISNHTHYPLFAHFLPSQRRKQLLEAMIHHGSPKARVGLLRSDLGASDTRRYCPECLAWDLSAHGVALWHREHTLPGTELCPEHGIKLIEVPVTAKFGERELILPEGVTPAQNFNSAPVVDALFFISQQIKILLERTPVGVIDGKVYREILREEGLITKKGSVRQRSLVKAITAWLKPLHGISEFRHLTSTINGDRSWPADLVDVHKGFHHPIKHIVLWGALALDAQSILNSSAAIGEQLLLPLAFEKPIRPSADYLQEFLDQSGSYRRAAKSLGVDVNTLLVWAEAEGLPIKHRTKSITPEKRGAIKRDLLMHPVSVVAQLHRVSVATVYRIRRVSSYPHIQSKNN